MLSYRTLTTKRTSTIYIFFFSSVPRFRCQTAHQRSQNCSGGSSACPNPDAAEELSSLLSAPTQVIKSAAGTWDTLIQLHVRLRCLLRGYYSQRPGISLRSSYSLAWRFEGQQPIQANAIPSNRSSPAFVTGLCDSAGGAVPVVASQLFCFACISDRRRGLATLLLPGFAVS